MNKSFFRPLKGSTLLALGLITLLGSCTTYRFIRQMNDTEVHHNRYTNGTIEYDFIPMIHVAKPEFYQNVKQAVTDAKNDGYVLYYEWVEFENTSMDDKLKIREMVGLLPTPEGYANVLKPLIEEGYEAQTKEMFLNLVNSEDYNVDITGTELVSKYEDMFGTIEITEENRTTPLTDAYKATQDFDDVEKVILDYRNVNIANTIAKGDHKKIIILYGAKHEDGIFELLQEMDSNWTEIED